MSQKKFALTLGPLQFNWPADVFADFYARIADEAPVDRVVIGESVCSKRTSFYADRIPAGADFLAINGVQTLSHKYCSLIGDLDRLASAGVTGLRLSPHSGDFVAVTRAFADAAAGRISPEEGFSRLRQASPDAEFSNGFLFGDCGAAPPVSA